jgi:transcription antitermination protein NusB
VNDSSVAPAGSRREGRERVLGLLYEAESKSMALDELVEGLPLPLTGYAARLVEGIGPDPARLDHLIEAVSHRWRVARMPAVDRAVLRMATHELAERQDVPAGAVISEAVDLAAEYSTEASSRFVNGVLARLATELRPKEATGIEVPELADPGDAVRAVAVPELSTE